MPLKTMLQINLPYGFAKNRRGEWYAFNREYQPLGQMTRKDLPLAEYEDLFGATQFHGLTENKMKQLQAATIHRDSEGKPFRFYLYIDATDPSLSDKLLADYMKKLTLLANLKRPSTKF